MNASMEQAKLETSFDFLGFVFYCIKKWMIVALAAAVCALMFVVLTLSKDTYVRDVYEGGVGFYSILQFMDENSGSLSLDNPSIEEFYKTTSKRAMSDLASGTVESRFMKRADVLKEMRVIFDDPKLTANHDFIKEFSESFSTRYTDYDFVVRFEARLNTEQKKQSAAILLNIYLDEAIGYASERLASTSISISAFERIDPSQQIVKNFIYGSGVFSSFVKGGLLGGLLGGVACVFIYFIDPRVKNLNSLKALKVNLIAKSKGGVAEKNVILSLLARTKNDKSVLLASMGQKDDFVCDFAKGLALESSLAGLRTLYIDCKNISGTVPSLKGFIGGTQMPLRQAEGYDMLAVESDVDWALLIGKKDAVERMHKDYDKIIFACADSANGAVVVMSELSDKCAIMLNHKADSLKSMKQLVENLGKTECIGAYIYNSL